MDCFSKTGRTGWSLNLQRREDNAKPYTAWAKYSAQRLTSALAEQYCLGLRHFAARPQCLKYGSQQVSYADQISQVLERGCPKGAGTKKYASGPAAKAFATQGTSRPSRGAAASRAAAGRNTIRDVLRLLCDPALTGRVAKVSGPQRPTILLRKPGAKHHIATSSAPNWGALRPRHNASATKIGEYLKTYQTTLDFFADWVSRRN